MYRVTTNIGDVGRNSHTPSCDLYYPYETHLASKNSRAIEKRTPVQRRRYNVLLPMQYAVSKPLPLLSMPTS
jgi:5-methylcytosine-specific restriction endonuclease McrA